MLIRFLDGIGKTYTKEGVTYKSCVYLDYEGNACVDEHGFDKDGFCNICGNTKEQSKV